MKITYDLAKRALVIKERGLDFEDAAIVFSGRTLTLLDDRKEYGELRYQSYGYLNKRMVMIVWTPRGAERRIISMRYCHEKEESQAKKHLE